MFLPVGHHPDRVALQDGDGPVTYGELLELPAPRDRFVVAEPHRRTVAAVLRGGIVLLDPRLTETERQARVNQVTRSPDSLQLFTSGTTGAPKPVAIHAGQIEASAAAFAARMGTGTWLCPLPLAHVGGLMAVLRPLLSGDTVVFGSPEDVVREDIDFASLVPTQLKRLLDAGLRNPPARIILGGAPPPPRLLDRARDAGFKVSVTFGMTETCSMVTLDGVPLDGVGIEIRADGEIVVRGPMVQCGEHRTGDLGRFEDGVLRVIGRKSDTIITGAENVAPAEIEAVLAEHPAVADVAVIGRPDPEWGERLTALVVLADGVAMDPAALREFCRARLAPFKVPKAFEAVEELPRATSGKLRRRELQ